MAPSNTHVRIFHNGHVWCALLSGDSHLSLAGYGPTPAEALRDLASRIEAEGMTFERSTKPFLVPKHRPFPAEKD